MQRGISLVRWDPAQPLAAGNVILLTKAEADQHEKGTLEIDDAIRSRILHTLSGAAAGLPEKQKSKRELKREANKEIAERVKAKEADKAKRAAEWASGIRTTLTLCCVACGVAGTASVLCATAASIRSPRRSSRRLRLGPSL